MDDLPIAPPKGEITVRPKEVPKVDTPKLDLPDAPQTPNAPKVPSPKSPIDPTKLIPPIAGATTATVGKLAADAVNSEVRNNQSFVGTLRGESVTLRNIELRQIQYTKRTDEAREALRKTFDRNMRSDFLKNLANDPQKVINLRRSGIDESGIERMREGKNPRGWQVHHKLPIDDGGDNSFNNLVLIKNDPYHLTITNQQNGNIKGMKAGDTKVFDWVIPPGYVYPSEQER